MNQLKSYQRNIDTEFTYICPEFLEMRIIKFIILSSCMLLLSCQDESNITKDIEAIKVDIKVKRFDLDFANTTAQSLPFIKSEYPYLFPAHFPDSIWFNKLGDTLQMQLNQAVQAEFDDFSSVKNDLNRLFKHVQYFTPEITIPEVVTVTSYVDYRKKIIYADSLLLISLDTYLGKTIIFMKEYSSI